MGAAALTGSRIREKRAQAGLRQAELARAAGLSASYLNLIEHNRRRIGDALLEKLATALGTSRAALEGAEEAETIAALREAAASAQSPPPEPAHEFASRFPQWATLMAQQTRHLQQLERSLETLGGRISQDDHLSAKLHELLSAATSVRATAAILTETPDLEPEWRARFEANLSQDTARLAQGAEAVASDLAAMGKSTGLLSPQEELEAWLASRGWHLPELEAGEDPNQILARAEVLQAPAAKSMALLWLRLCAQDAQKLPLSRFLQAMRRANHDIGKLAEAFGVSPAAVFRRYAMLPEGVGAAGVFIADGAGALLLQRAPQGFALPRYGPACPLLPLFTAIATAGRPVRTRLTMAGREGGSFDARAWCETRYPDGFEASPVIRSYMLLLPEAAAPALAETLVGNACRLCPRNNCPARREPSMLAEYP